MKSPSTIVYSLAVLLCSVMDLFAGGSGLNVMVVVNQNSTNSVQLGNYYCEKRQVPPQNVLRVNWPSTNFIVWDKTNFESVLLFPLQAAIASRGLTNQIDYIVLSMDLPFGVFATNGFNSTTSALFYGFKPDGDGPNGSCNLPFTATNSYAGSEEIFRDENSGIGHTNFLAVMLTTDSLERAKRVVDNGVKSDGTFPTQPVLLVKSDDVIRNIRYALFDDTVFNTRVSGHSVVTRTNSLTTLAGGTTDLTQLTNVLGYENGVAKFVISSNAFVPGAMADQLTSNGGVIFGNNGGQTRATEFLNAGAIGTYGTVVEPCAYLAKFPSSQNYFYQARGFTMAECYYQSVQFPYQGLTLGEPLAAPFAQPGQGTWSHLSSDAVLRGVTNLSVQFNAGDARHPLDQVDLFVDGVWLQTLTNLPPRQFNTLFVTANGATTNVVVPANASIEIVASNLTAALNRRYFTNAAKIQAFRFGDRIELRSFDVATPGSQISLSVSNSAGLADELQTFVAASRPDFLDTIASGIRSYLVAGEVVSNDFLKISVTKTNGAMVTVAVTNLAEGVSLTSFAQKLLDAVNTNPLLQNEDGLIAEDLYTYETTTIGFNLRARGVGINAAQIQADLNGSFTLQPTGTRRLNENLSDLQPRNHLYVTAGGTNLAVTFPFDTAALPDGFHELTAVADEGSHVRTQTRVSQTARVQNSSLMADFFCLLGGTNTAVETTLQFSVIANTNDSAINKTELFSTGGLLASINGQSNAIFSVPGTNLDLGLHPFYALVTRNDGQRYRTETKWIRLVATTPDFSILLTNPPPIVTWPAVAGRTYEILGASNLSSVFQLRGTVTPANSVGIWVETNSVSAQQFYRVRVSP